MKNLLIILTVIMAGSCYANLTNCYNNDTKQWPSKVTNDRQWVYVYPSNGNFLAYKLTDRYVEACLLFIAPGHYILENELWNALYWCIDRSGQNWKQAAIDKFGQREFSTNDGRIYAKLMWVNGQQIFRICYASFLTKAGLWRYDKSIATHSTHAKSRLVKRQPKESIPTVENYRG